MRFIFNTVLLSLFSLFVTKCNAQGIEIIVPAPGAVIYAGQNMTVQIVRPDFIQSVTEVGLAIGLLNCGAGTTACPAPGAEFGDVLYAGPFNPQFHGPGQQYQNFTLYVPSVAQGAVTGPAQLEVGRFFLIGAGRSPTEAFYNVSVTIAALPTAPFTIHPEVNSNKCVGIVGGTYANGSQVDIYDCNGSNTQKWQWFDRALVSVNPVDQSQWCLDAGVVSQLANGVQMKIWECITGLPQQTWDVPAISDAPIALSVGDWCLDLTNGSTTNRNILQVWDCVGNGNQRWTFTNV